MSKQCSINSWNIISLHDCRVTHIKQFQQNIVLIFSEGFWLKADHPENKSGKIIGTDKSQVTLKQGKFDEILLQNDLNQSLFDTISSEQFINKIISSEWEFEIIDESFQDHKVTYSGWVWFEREPFHKDCQITCSFGEVEYCWCGLMEDRNASEESQP